MAIHYDNFDNTDYLIWFYSEYTKTILKVIIVLSITDEHTQNKVIRLCGT